jgi:tripartite-type tricarboxylate transporter receptor subunit TctC
MTGTVSMQAAPRIATLLIALALAVFPMAASGQTWPTRPIKLIAPVSPGIATDVVARMLSEHVSRALGQQIYVENVPGASGTVGSAAAARAAPDGYTFLFASAGMLSTNKFLFKSLPFDMDRDFAPVAIVCMGTPFAISVTPQLPVRSLPDLIALAKARPGQLSYATDISSGLAGIIGDLLNRRAGIRMVQVPYRASAQAIQDTMAGTTDAMISSALSVESFVQSGKLRRIAITSARPFPGMEDSPPVAETLPDFKFEGWFAVAAPAGTPGDVVARLAREIDAFVSDPDAGRRLTSFGCLPNRGGTPQSADAFLQAERERWSGIVQELDIKPQ